MNDETGPDDAPVTPSTGFELGYSAPSNVETADGSARLALFGNLHRDPVQFDGRIRDPLRLREALSVLYQVVGSDFRYKPKDRTAYLAYSRMRRETAGLNLWQAQQAYFTWLARNDPLAFLILDPIISVHPDEVFFEVFSKDEGTYGRLSVSLDGFDLDESPVCGTTNIDFSEGLFEGLQQLRSFREARLTIAQEMVGISDEQRGEVLEKQISVPDSWLRGFLQVQSAITLPRESFQLAPLDIYNALRHLRLHADRKGKPRGLRVELVPGEQPTLVLEPWELVIRGTGPKYTGRQSRIVRVWGRRRLMMMRRLLPFVELIDVHVLGSGLPSFWEFRSGPLKLTLGLTGFTAANWSQAIGLDLLLPRTTQRSSELETVIAHLAKTFVADLAELGRATGLKGAKLTEAIQLGCQQGQLILTPDGRQVRLRPLTNTPLELGRLEYRNERERQAYDLVARRNAVKIISENRILGTGLELTGQVTVTDDKRDYRPQMLIDDESRVLKANCTCTFFRKHGLKQGPCAHLIALRLAWGHEEKKRAADRGRQRITMETRTYSRRHPDGREDVTQLTLDRQRLKVRWGRAGENLRSQTLQFNDPNEARAAYFSRVEALSNKGFVDATAG